MNYANCPPPLNYPKLTFCLLSAVLWFTATNAQAEVISLYTDSAAQNMHQSNSGYFSAGGWFKDAAGNSLYLTGGLLASYEVAGGEMNNPFGNESSSLATVSSLADSSYTALQQAQIQSLFDHVYYKAYKEDSFAPGTIVKDAGYASMLASTLDIILYSLTPNSQLSLTQAPQWYNGDWEAFCYVETSLGMTSFNAEGAIQITEWINAINNDSWDLLGGYDEIHVELTSYDIQYASAFVKMIAVENNTSVTPEPATMLIFGLGAAGLFASRKLRKGKK